MCISRNNGPLLRDLISVLLRVDPSERPSAKQILHIPAMKEHVDKVLGRGRMQRAERVSCSVSDLPAKGHVRQTSHMWRKPNEVACSAVDARSSVAAVVKDDQGVVSCERQDNSREKRVLNV